MSTKVKIVMSDPSKPSRSKSRPLLQAVGITKNFGDFVANDDVSFSIHAGEIHALVGENGAGKSSLMSVLYGLNLNYSGKIIFNDKEVFWASPRDAIQHGIGMVHQHFMLVENFSVLENIILGLKESLFLEKI